MALWTAGGGGQAATTGITGTSLPNVTVTASATPHTMGSWVTLVASTAFVVDGVTLGIFAPTFASGVDTSMLLDIGVGAAASELVVAGGIPVGWGPAAPRTIFLPIRIASGVRIAARVQSAVASATCAAGLILSGGGGWLRPASGSVVDSYGVNSGTSSGTAIADIASQHVKGAYTVITASTTRRHRYLLPLTTLAAGVSTILSSTYLYDVAIGSAGNEVVILPNLTTQSVTTEENRQPTLQAFPVDIPAGTQLSARQQKALSTGNPLSLVLLGIS